MSNPSAGGSLLSSPEATGKLRARINALHIEEDELKAKLTPEQYVAFTKDAGFRAKVMKLYEKREEMDHKLQTERARKLHYNDEDEKMRKIWSKQDRELERHHNTALHRNKEQLSFFKAQLSKTPAKEREKRRGLERNIDICLQDIQAVKESYESDKQQFSKERQELIRKQERKSLSEINKVIEEITNQLDNFDIAKEAGNPPRYMGLGTGPKPERRERPVEQAPEAPESPKPKGQKLLKEIARSERDEEYYKTHKPYSPLTKEQVEKGNDLEKAKIKLHSVTQVVKSIPEGEVSERSGYMRASMALWLYKVKTKSKALLETNDK
jgi:hypothetical protein